eukprot:gene42792-57943_t
MLPWSGWTARRVTCRKHSSGVRRTCMLDLSGGREAGQAGIGGEMKRIRTGLLVVIMLAGVGAWFLRGDLAIRLMERRLAVGMATNVVAGLPDGLHVAVCGSGGPFPDGDRGAPCTAVIAGKRLFIVDTGEAAGRTLGRMGIAGNSVVLLTHFHSDHIDGLGNVAMQRSGCSRRRMRRRPR